jgi:transposase
MTKRRKFEKAFKLEVVNRSLEENISVKELAEELSIHPSVITRWRRQYLTSGENSFPGHGVEQLSEEEREIRRLKKELADAKLETEILKKAIRIFSKSDGKSMNS